MTGHREIGYAVDFGVGRKGRQDHGSLSSERERPAAAAAGGSVARVARLLALALRFEGLLREGTMRDYAELARLGGVTRALMTQIMKLLQLAPDIQEQILFSAEARGLNERNLRPVVRRIDWDEQRLLFRKIMERSGKDREPA